MSHEKVSLVICDGLGLTPEVNGNAFTSAQTPTFDYLLKNYPSMRLLAAGTEVGLDMGEPGNSEVGHLSIGTGQIVPQAFQIINASIKSEAYRKNKAFVTILEPFKRDPDKMLHIVGLVSRGGVHGHIDHIITLLHYAKEHGVRRVAVHGISDGRDTAPKVVLEEIKPLLEVLHQFEVGVLATIGGRFFALDRDSHWDRTDAFYWALMGKSRYFSSSLETAVTEGYGRGESDENLQPTVFVDAQGHPLAPIQAGDAVIITNYRPDRIRQLATRIIMMPNPIFVLLMTDYFLGKIPESPIKETRVVVAYPLPKPKVTLAGTLARSDKRQLHIAETEKYAHITYFFDGHEEEKNNLEEWLLIPSVRVASFDWVPEMSAPAITNAYLQAKMNNPPDFTVINYANMDMVAHTGNLEATIMAVTNVDIQLRTLVQYAEEQQEWLIITADHGNCEHMVNPETHEIDKEHTNNPVPVIIVHPKLKQPRAMDKFQLAVLSNIGMLADVAPTILAILGVNKPSEMAGTSLLKQLT